MIKSMTAFGRAKVEGTQKDITVEIKSVNSRFFDCSVKMPRAYLSLEERIKNYVQKNAVSRAKVDVFITVDNHSTAPQKIAPSMRPTRKLVPFPAWYSRVSMPRPVR